MPECNLMHVAKINQKSDDNRHGCLVYDTFLVTFECLDVFPSFSQCFDRIVTNTGKNRPLLRRILCSTTNTRIMPVVKSCFLFRTCISTLIFSRLEQGAPYPVLIRGHSLRKTRAPPSSTSQLDENFDAITQDGTTTARTPLRRRDWETERTSSPLDEDFDLMTSSGGGTTERGSMYRNSPRPLPPDGGYRYATERSQVYSPDGSRMGVSGSGAQGPSRHGTITRSTSAAHGRHGSAPQFEVVKSQIVEDGPERTVTVSLWKEQVAKPIGPNGETMSVHYYSAQDVLPDAMYANETRRDDYATPSEVSSF